MVLFSLFCSLRKSTRIMSKVWTVLVKAMPLKNYLQLLNWLKVHMLESVICLSKKCFIVYCLLTVVICYKKLLKSCTGKLSGHMMFNVIFTQAYYIYYFLISFCLVDTKKTFVCILNACVYEIVHRLPENFFSHQSHNLYIIKAIILEKYFYLFIAF